jgi:CMP/dCMP kinase
MADVFQIALDGPVAAGKGTVARLVAERLGFLYVDTGAMYRATALLAIQHGVDLHDEAAIVELLKKAKIFLRNPLPEEKDGRLTTVLLDDQDVSWKIRTEEISRQVSVVAAHSQVRAQLVIQQQAIASVQNVVMEGRDIAIRVLPNAQLKLYLTANEIVRAKRRHLELQTRGQDIPFSQVLEDLMKRDLADTTREVDPLTVTDEHVVIDTSDLAIEKVVDLIVAKATVMMELP